MKKINLLLGCMPLVAILGCSTQHEFNHQVSYVDQPRLQVAPGLTGQKMQEDYYPIPGGLEGSDGQRQPASMLPPGSHISEYGTVRKSR